MYQPVIPTSGIAGWSFLQATYDRQLDTFSNSAEIRNDRDHMIEAFSKPISVESLLDDRRLLRTALTAFGLQGEEWKRGFIEKVLQEVSDPESTFLARLNNPQYTRFAESMRPVDGTINLSPEALLDLGGKFEKGAFQNAVGETDNSMRLSLNFQSEIGELVGNGSSDNAVLFRILGSVPVRTVLETATNLPSAIRSLPIEKQAEMMQERLQSSFGINNLSELTSPDTINRIIQRFHAIESISQGGAPNASTSVALTLLKGIGSQGSQNLFLGSLL